MKFFILFCLAWGLAGCTTSDMSLLERAEREASQQRAQLSKHLYLQVILHHSKSDDIRFRALKGLMEVSFAQLFDYRGGLAAFEKLLEEYGKNPTKKEEMDRLRIQAARVWRLQLQRPEKALEILEAFTPGHDESKKALQEIGRTYVALKNYEEAEEIFKQSWGDAMAEKQCSTLKSLQLDLIQVHSLSKRCESAIQWAKVSFPVGCNSDIYSVQLEEAHCHEMLGDFLKAKEIYEAMVRSNPTDSRAHFLLQQLKDRQKEKLVK